MMHKAMGDLASNWRVNFMRILQPADWSKPRGFSHGVAIESPGRWIVLAGQTGDENGDYPPDMAGQDIDVCFTLKSGYQQMERHCPLSVRSGHWSA
jgi:hypothetical protein